MNLQQQQYNCIGTVAKHCDSNKLCTAENEASNFDLAELFCDYWFMIVEIDEEVQSYILALAECEANPECTTPPEEPSNYDEKYTLLYGGFYLDCESKQRPFEGVYTILAYYSYSRYIILNGFSDTPNGIVTKTNEF